MEKINITTFRFFELSPLPYMVINLPLGGLLQITGSRSTSFIFTNLAQGSRNCQCGMNLKKRSSMPSNVDKAKRIQSDINMP